MSFSIAFPRPDRKRLARSRRRRSGVGVTEYMLLISVLVVAIVAIGWTFAPTFRTGTYSLANDIKNILMGEDTTDTPDRNVGECPYVFDSRTGRWHDPDAGNLMVSFDEAQSSGC